MRAAIAMALLALAPCAAQADSLEEIFRRANAAHFRGDYDAAAIGYRQLLALGVTDPDVTYNLGATELKRGRHGAAIQMFERTLWLRSGDADAERGLEAARAILGGQRAQSRGEAEVEAGPEIGEALFGGVSPALLAVTALVLDVLLFAALAALLFVRRESVRLGLGVGAVIAAAGLLVAGTGVVLRAGWLEDGEPAVVLGERVALREGPDPRASERGHALEGQRAWMLEREDGWMRVRVPQAGEGWIESSSVGLVRER